MYTKKIYFSGGSAYELQEVFEHVPGVRSTRVGCMNPAPAEGDALPPGGVAFEAVLAGRLQGTVGVEVTFDPKKIDLSMLLDILFAVVSPYEPDGQGTSRGAMFRVGVYYEQAEDEPQLEYHLNFIASRGKPPATVCASLTVNDPISDQRQMRKCYARARRLTAFCPADEKHQHYLTQHPEAVTFIDFKRLRELQVLAD